MSPHDAQLPPPPDGLLPAQLGVVLLGRPVLGHAAATLVDLAERGFLQVTEDSSNGWQLERLPTTHTPKSMQLASFEDGLLTCVPARGAVLLIELANEGAFALQRFAHHVVHDAVHHGWLRHLHHRQRTPEGERLLAEIRAYRTTLRKASADEDGPSGRLPYALTFGLPNSDRLPLARFADKFVRACSDLPGWKRPEPIRPGFPAPDFPHDEWRGMGLGGAAILDMFLG
jgi:hypothetical protein